MLHNDVSEPLLNGPSSSQVAVLLEDDSRVPHSVGQCGSTVLQGTCNVVNVFVGLGLLAMPYALRLSGWAGIAALLATTALFATSGKLFLRAFDALPPGVPHTYPDLGEYVTRGPIGRYLVLALTSLELFGSTTMCLIVLWKEVEQLLPQAGVGPLSRFNAAATMCLAAAMPLLLLPNLRNVSWLSGLGFACSSLVTLTIDALLVLDPTRKHVSPQPPAGHAPLHVGGMFQALGIFACSVSGHSTFPALRAVMRRPSDFDGVIHYSFATMLLVYGSVAGVGYYYFGDAVDPLIINNLAAGSVYSGHPVLGHLRVSTVLQALVALRSYTAFPAMVMVLQELAVSILPLRPAAHSFHRTPTRRLQLLLRFAISACCAVTAYIAYNMLGSLVSLVGGFCSMMCSVVLPCICFLVLRWDHTSTRVCTAVAAMAGLGCALVVLIVAQNLVILLR